MHDHNDAMKAELAENLACVLASAYTLQLKLHGFHWNVKGKDFTEFHGFFGMLQDDIYGMVDATAENILKLGFDAPASLSEMLMHTCIEDGSVHVGEPIDMTLQFLAANESMIEAINRAFQLATAIGEQGIADFLAARDDAHKKWSWQARAISGLQPSRMLGKADAGLLETAKVAMPSMVEGQLIAAAPCCADGCSCTPGACTCGPDCTCGCKQMLIATGKVQQRKSAMTAGAKRKILFSKDTDDALKDKMNIHNQKAPSGRKATLSMLRAVYRRGAQEYVGSLSDVSSRNAVAMSRVNAFLRLLSSGSSPVSGYNKDNDLLPAGHPRATLPNASTLTASAVAESEMHITLKNENDYESTEEALVAMAEYSGLSYGIIPALKAAWTRGVKDDENPFERAKNLSVFLYNSKDADLLPRRKVDSL